jgi:hypothetical protein
VLAAEATACCDGLILARERGFLKVELETDCQVLVNLWNKRSTQKSEISPLIDQMEDLSRSFEGFSFHFISRTCNKLAHACAQMVSRNSQVVEWPITPPGFTDIIDSDCKFVTLPSLLNETPVPPPKKKILL